MRVNKLRCSLAPVLPAGALWLAFMRADKLRRSLAPVLPAGALWFAFMRADQVWKATIGPCLADLRRIQCARPMKMIYPAVSPGKTAIPLRGICANEKDIRPFCKGTPGTPVRARKTLKDSLGRSVEKHLHGGKFFRLAPRMMGAGKKTRRKFPAGDQAALLNKLANKRAALFPNFR